jgi:hypothetical protein
VEEAMKLPVVEKGWQYNDVCPCDTEFIEYLETLNLDRMKLTTIFHMGPGMHHKIGLWATMKKNVLVRSITLAPEELNEYVRLATEDPWINTCYLVDFGDIHLMDTMLLPRLDFISLFHLGEISEQIKNDEYPGKTISEVLGGLSRRLSIGGQMLFYERSVAWQSIFPIIETSLFNKYRYKKLNYKNIAIYQKV